MAARNKVTASLLNPPCILPGEARPRLSMLTFRASLRRQYDHAGFQLRELVGSTLRALPDLTRKSIRYQRHPAVDTTTDHH